MFIGIIYSIVILVACILGAIVGLSGGLFFRPIFDAIGHHNVMNIGFFASTAILFMAIVSTIKKIQDGTKINPRIAILISLGAILGGVIGNLLLEHLLAFFPNETAVQFIQIALTVMVLIISLIFTAKNNLHYELKNNVIIITLGILLGTIASFLGIGGGPLNVPIFMIFFGLGIKDATAYSIVIILFAHLSRLITLGLTVGYFYFDLAILPYVIVAASLGGLIGAKLTKVFSDKTVKRLFQATLCLVMLLNIASGLILL
ncbi:MAG: sulfite exporter TauE/SafE family protein [Spirochaetaceae bacterium]|nr:sulfite exporter TauE/SafE family protein [Spirochaetaceae bacterium]